MAVLEEALAAGCQPVALVSHGCLVTLMLRELDPAFGFGDWIRMTTPDVCRATRRDEAWRVDRVGTDA